MRLCVVAVNGGNGKNAPRSDPKIRRGALSCGGGFDPPRMRDYGRVRVLWAGRYGTMRWVTKLDVPPSIPDIRRRDSPSLQLLAYLFAFAFAALCVMMETSAWIVAVGMILIMSPVFFLQWKKWRTEGSKWGGIFLLYPAAFCLAYAIGSLRLGLSSPLGVYPDGTQWLLYGVGLIAFMLGAATGLKNSPSVKTTSIPITITSTQIAVVSGIVGLSGAAVNFATGGIPLLAENINSSRFGDNTSLLGPVTGIIVGLEHFALVVLLIDRWARKSVDRRVSAFHLALVIAITISLFASGSRTFLILPFVAYALARIELSVVKLLKLTIVALVAFSLLATFNMYRQEQSGTADSLNTALVRNELDQYPFPSGLLSLQIGPRVFQATRDKVPDVIDYQHGSFFFADGSVLLRTSQPSSDSFITTQITRRNYSTVGGSPPTVLGGFYIDGGIPLIIAGMLALGFITRRLRNTYLKNVNPYTAAAYGYWATWMLHSIYNYVSFKPMVLTFMVMCFIGAKTIARAKTMRPLPS